MKKPEIAQSAHVFSGAVIRGNVRLQEESSVWHNVVLRGDIGFIDIGKRSNVQDGTIVHTEIEGETILGDDVSIGHGCILHGCIIGDCSLIGLGSILLNNVKVGKECIIGAGSLVTNNTVIPDGMMAFGRPAKVIRPLTEEEKETIRFTAREYIECAERYEEEDKK